MPIQVVPRIPMNSIDESCNDLKKQYDTCFMSWFKDEFMKGGTNDAKCAAYFKQYHQCIKKAMKEQHIDLKEIERDLLGTKNENQSSPKNS
uniref:TP53-regulated inhibitor of apoptosis 1 n=1 Tax=Timema monikensis TaxID=170555 RepID=A0A7R9E7S8_9NEOP|nr:unnamed protein product [Timema monikensis]